MSATLGLWEEVAAEVEDRAESAEMPAESQRTPVGQFVSEQLLGLIRAVFFAGWPRPARYVIFAGISEDAGNSGICMRVAETLASQTTGRVCVVETDPKVPSERQDLGGLCTDGGHTPEFAGAVRVSSRQLTQSLWLVPAIAWRPVQQPLTVQWMRQRMGELRAEFDYAVIHAPPVGICGEAGLLAQLADGLVLVLEAHRTRRAAARTAQEKLQAANIRMLGAVLNGRTFPIPERLYRRL